MAQGWPSVNSAKLLALHVDLNAECQSTGPSSPSDHRHMSAASSVLSLNSSVDNTFHRPMSKEVRAVLSTSGGASTAASTGGS